MIIETIEYSWFGLNWLQNVAELLNDPLTCKRGHILGVFKWGRTRQRHSEQLSGSNGERGKKIKGKICNFPPRHGASCPSRQDGRSRAGRLPRHEEQRSINGLRESDAQYLTSVGVDVWLCLLFHPSFPLLFSVLLLSFFHLLLSHFLPSPCISFLLLFIYLCCSSLFPSFSPALPLPLPLIFTPSYSSPPPLPPPYPLPPFLSSRYRPHRGVLRLPLRRLRSDHGATASPTEHRDHAAHRQDDRGGKNTLMSSSFCMLSHVVPVTILHQLNVLKFKYPEIN